MSDSEHGFSFEIVRTCPETGARAGILRTPHSVIETPVFMPVGTQATVKTMSQQELEDIDVRIILGNTYHLYLRPGAELVRGRRTARIYGMGRLHTYGFGRFPGVQS